MVGIVAALLLSAPVRQWDVVVSAELFADKLGLVYRQGVPQLYKFHLDGTGLQKLTSGPLGHIEPTLAIDGRSVNFEEGQVSDNGYFESGSTSCRFDASGNVVRLNSHKRAEYWYRDVSESIPRSKYLKVDKDGYATIVPAKGEPFGFDGSPRLSPDGLTVLVTSFEKGSGIVNLKTGRSAKLDAKIQMTVWIDSKTILGIVDSTPEGLKPDAKQTAEVLQINLDGSIRHRAKFNFSGVDDPDNIFDALGRGEQLGPTPDPDTVLIEQHHSMSDGGYNFSHSVNLKTGEIKASVDGTIFAESPDHTKIISGVARWIGGYKNPGSRKMQRLHIWDTRTWESHEIGFRRMLCDGACFVPRR